MITLNINFGGIPRARFGALDEGLFLGDRGMKTFTFSIRGAGNDEL